MRPVERLVCRITGIDERRQMNLKQYLIAFLIFSMVGTLLLYAILRLQQFLPCYDAAHLTTPMAPDLAINTAISFSTIRVTNLFEMLAIVVLPAALTNTFGRMVGSPRQGWMLFWVMCFLFVIGIVLTGWAEQSSNPALAPYVTAGQPMGNMEGKEVRFGVSGSVLTAVTTSNGATGSTNSMHDSYTPLGGAVLLVNMLLGEMIFGGLGTGIYSILMVALIGVFLTGLMIGRTPEYLGKRIEPSEMKMLAIYALMGPVALLLMTSLAVVSAPGLAGLTM